MSIGDFFQKHKKNLFNFWTVVYIDKKIYRKWHKNNDNWLKQRLNRYCLALFSSLYGLTDRKGTSVQRKYILIKDYEVNSLFFSK